MVLLYVKALFYTCYCLGHFIFPLSPLSNLLKSQISMTAFFLFATEVLLALTQQEQMKMQGEDSEMQKTDKILHPLHNTTCQTNLQIY